MKDKHKSWQRAGILTVTVITIPYFAMAQDPGPCPDCPIDGGVILLLAAGIGYGVKKYRYAKKLREENV